MTLDLVIGRRFLAAQGAPGALAVGVTGAHYYGFPSPDSDLDLKGVHVADTREIVSLRPPPDAIDYLGVFEGIEIDYTSHKLAVTLRLLPKGNGNILERILSPFQLLASETVTELQALARGAVSQTFFHHYRGFFGRTCQDWRTAQPKTVKGLLYAYRSALTGMHLRLQRLEALLETARSESPLPPVSPNAEAINELLIRMRRSDTRQTARRVTRRIRDKLVWRRLPRESRNERASTPAPEVSACVFHADPRLETYGLPRFTPVALASTLAPLAGFTVFTLAYPLTLGGRTPRTPISVAGDISARYGPEQGGKRLTSSSGSVGSATVRPRRRSLRARFPLPP